MIRFKYNELLNQWIGDNKRNGDHYVLASRSVGEFGDKQIIHTYLNGELVDDRCTTFRSAKQNVRDNLEAELSVKLCTLFGKQI